MTVQLCQLEHKMPRQLFRFKVLVRILSQEHHPSSKFAAYTNNANQVMDFTNQIVFKFCNDSYRIS